MANKTLNNYIPINRKFFDHPFWKEERVYSQAEAWLDLLQQARFEAAQGKKLIGHKIVTWNRGQLIAPLRFLANRWQWSTKKVTAFLDLLKKEKMIKRETQQETGQSLLTICNYESYNLSDEERKQFRKQDGNTMETPWKQDGNKTNIDNKGNKGERDGELPENFSGKVDLPVTPIYTRPAHAPTYEQALAHFSLRFQPHMTDAFMLENDKTDWTYRDGSPIITWQAWADGFIKRVQRKAEKDAEKAAKALVPKGKQSKHVFTEEDDY